MTALESLRRIAAEQSRNRLMAIGAAASLFWLMLAALIVWLDGESGPQDATGWMIWLLGLLLPLGLIWFGVWSARSLSLLRQEAEDLRASLHEIRLGSQPQTPHPHPRVVPPRPAAPRPVVPLADQGQASLDLGATPAPELTPSELFLALNFPDGPDDHEAIRCLRLALADPELARLIRAAQDVVTLLAGQGVYMDDLSVPETDPVLWADFAQGLRGAPLHGLAVIEDAEALAISAQMLREDEIFRDVAHHFLRRYDRLLARRIRMDEPVVLAVLSESRSGRAFLLLAQTSGMLGRAETGS